MAAAAFEENGSTDEMGRPGRHVFTVEPRRRGIVET